MNKLARLLRHDWPLHFLLILLDLLPDNVPFLKLRGFLAHFFFGQCGPGLELGRCVSFYNPANIHLGKRVYLAHGVRILAIDTVSIGDECLVGPYTVIASANHTQANGSFRKGEPETRPIRIEKGCWLGAHVTVAAGALIGAGAAVGAGAVVIGDIPAGALAVGVPARVKKQQEAV